MWFKRPKEPLKTEDRHPIPDGVWVKCESCGEILYRKELMRNLGVCPKCRYHSRISAQAYIDLLLDPGSAVENDAHLVSADPLGFKDSVRYPERVEKNRQQAKTNDAIRCLSGTMEGLPVELGVMEFAFMGGSVGAVVGEKLRRAIDRAVQEKRALVTVACSGGMRMQEGVWSLMQMAKVSASLVALSEAHLPFISILTNPTTGGTTASFAMLGDVNIAEPGALIGFAGPRVIKQTIGQDLPEKFQTAEFLLEKGFLDLVVERSQLKGTVVILLRHLYRPQRFSPGA